MPQPVMLKKLKLNGSMKIYKTFYHKRDVLFIIGDWNAKVGSQEIPGVTGKFGLGIQNEAQQAECTGHSKHPLPTTQETTLHMDVTRCSILKSDWLYSAAEDGEAIQSAKTRPGGDCGSHYELLIAKFRLKLKKVDKTTRWFRYDLKQILYDYTVEVRNKI